MDIVKIRRVGNSNVISLPRALEALGYRAGESVAVQETPRGELLIMPESRLRGRMHEIVDQVVAENREAFAILEAYDRDEAHSAAHTSDAIVPDE